ncbi:MAG: DUF881 domain-containing protein [Bacillota bacterium]
MKQNLWKVIILIFTVLLGFIMALQFKNVQGEYLYVPLHVINEYMISIDSEKKEIESLRKLLQEKQKKLVEYDKLKNDSGAIKETMLEELKRKELQSGMADIEGPGIVLVVSDATRELGQGEDPNNLIVHNQDILNLINDLNRAGAEALSINGQRVITTSQISCAGATIRINDQVFGQPFVIKAIGNPKTLEAAINAPGTYANLLREFGLFIEVSTVMNIKMPRYSEEIDFIYARVQE